MLPGVNSHLLLSGGCEWRGQGYLCWWWASQVWLRQNHPTILSAYIIKHFTPCTYIRIRIRIIIIYIFWSLVCLSELNYSHCMRHWKQLYIGLSLISSVLIPLLNVQQICRPLSMWLSLACIAVMTPEWDAFSVFQVRGGLLQGVRIAFSGLPDGMFNRFVGHRKIAFGLFHDFCV